MQEPLLMKRAAGVRGLLEEAVYFGGGTCAGSEETLQEQP